jgi:aldehyde dehydrogenase family 7 protein A1
VTSYCPANNQPIARVTQGNLQDYEKCITASNEAWKTWADVSTRHNYVVQEIVDCPLARDQLVQTGPDKSLMPVSQIASLEG